MKSSSNLIAPCLLLASIICTVNPLFAQTVSDAPRPEYYVARDMFEVGRILEAADGFKLAATRALQVGDQPWIDSIPSLVMRGECFYEQGKLALAMESYDAALIIALAFPSWLDQVQVPTDLAPVDVSSKAVTWFPSARKTQLLSYPAPGLLLVDVAAGRGVNGNAPVSMVTRVDAAEILRTMALALLRRGEILGPLAKHSPLAQPLDQLFANAGKQPAIWAKAAWGVLRGLHSISSGNGLNATQLLNEHAALNTEFDYFMTPIALYGMGRIEISNGKFLPAITLMQESSLRAGQLEQYSLLAEALHELAGVCTASNRVDLLPGLQAAAGWGNKRSPSVQVWGFSGATELAAAAGNLTAADALSKQATGALRGISSPRAQAHLAFANASLAFADNRAAVGTQQLEQALAFMRGNPQDGSAIPAVFQSQKVLSLLRTKSLTVQDAEQLLSEILPEPGANAWLTTPLETLARLTTASLPAYAMWVELAERRGTKEQLIERMDRLQRERLYQALPLGGRLFSWRTAVLDPALMPEATRALVTQTLQNTPTLASNTQQLIGLTKQLRQMPNPLEERQPSADAKKRFAELLKASEIEESQLMFQSLQRKPLDRFVPFAATTANLQSQVMENDVLISWIETNDKFYGTAIAKDFVETWSTTDAAPIREQLQTLLSDLGLSATVRPQIPADATDVKAAWRTSVTKLRDLLVPPDVQAKLAAKERLLIVPDGVLWYLPFEILPAADQRGPWLSRHAISYLPTIGSLPLAYSAPKVVDQSVVVTSNFFTTDRAANEAMIGSLLSSSPKSKRLDLTVKNNISSAMWLRLDIDQLVMCNKVEPPKSPFETILIPIDATRTSTLANWFESPHQVPSRVVMAGYQSTAAKGTLGDGSELFLPACGLLYSGTQAALISRWPVAGRSTQFALSRYMQELEFESPSSAWQRAAIALWAEELLVSDEPAMLPAAKDAAALVSGSHPKLWGSYMLIGDTR